MHLTRLVTGPDGKTNHFEEVDLPHNPGTNGTETIPLPNVKNAYIITLKKGYGAQRAPTAHHHKRQYIIILEGAMELTLVNGEKRVLGPGDLFCTDETSGEFHGTETSNRDRVALYIDFDEQFETSEGRA